MRKIKMGENGVTLVEILAALVLLSIVLIGFFSFFTQSATFTKHNKEKLTAVQIAEEVIADVRNGKYQDDTSIIKGDYEVNIVIEDGPADLILKKAIVTVNSLTDMGIKGSSFTTEMYFDGVLIP